MKIICCFVDSQPITAVVTSFKTKSMHILHLFEQQEYSLNKDISIIFGYNLLYKQPFSYLWNTEKIDNIKLHVQRFVS